MSNNSGTNFFKLFRRRGFSETLEILAECPNFELQQSLFFKRLTNSNSYPNIFFRVKSDLLKHNLIAYKLDKENNKVIYLTEKGVKIWNRINEIEKLL
ncbi:MAG: hypothetical protein DRO88_02310 [Promethearchaeia archaeon]|nr:MAG: hypothetical protein DRO88_02310 [Candidatus Lokiarchaeia archaeon]